ncbi:MAG: PadR family transcriptional regulator [Actinomycetota bacterium]
MGRRHDEEREFHEELHEAHGHGGGWGPPRHVRRMMMRGGFGPPWMMGGGPRARRGDVRTGILSVLAEQPMHGYDVIRELESRSGGRWRPSPGSVYPTLQMLEDEGLVRSEGKDGRRVFEITDAGREIVTARQEQGGPPWEDGADDPIHELRNAAFQLGAAAMQVSGTGSSEQIARTKAILDEARKKIYGILAES